MTLRLSPELDRALTAIAAAKHMSKQAVLISAAERYVRAEAKTAEVLASLDETSRDYAGLIARLEDA